MGKRSAGMAVGRALLGLGRLVQPLVPAPLRRAIEDRFFGAIFQVTRVTNDHYDQPGEDSGADSPQNR